MLIALLVPLGLGALVYIAILWKTAVERRQVAVSAEAIALGAVTNFFDTLGLGSFAPTTAWFKLRQMIPDAKIPCTLLPAHLLPVVVQAVIFLVLLGVKVDPILLFGCIISCVVGGVTGAALVGRSKVWLVQVVVGCALLLAALLYSMTALGLMPAGGTAASLPPGLTAAAFAGNFLFGLLVNYGVGHYAPTLIMFSLMGFDPRLAFPIMAAGGASMGVAAGARHVRKGTADIKMIISITIGGIPAVLIAAFLVKSMSVELLRWLVVVVVLYAAIVMLRTALAGRRSGEAACVDDFAAVPLTGAAATPSAPRASA